MFIVISDVWRELGDGGSRAIPTRRFVDRSVDRRGRKLFKGSVLRPHNRGCRSVETKGWRGAS